MPVKKPAAKKTVAKKSAPAKVAAKPTKKVDDDTTKESALVTKIVDGVKAGAFDLHLAALDSAISDRINTHIAEQRAAKKSASASKPAEKKVAAPPRKPVKSVEPVAGGTYLVADKIKSLAGAKVKFRNFKADSNGTKSVVEMVTEKPGSPKGKRIVIPTSGLVELPASKKPVKKKK